MPSKAAYFLLPVSMFFCTVLACGQTTSSTPHATLTVETANTAGISEKAHRRAKAAD